MSTAMKTVAAAVAAVLVLTGIAAASGAFNGIFDGGDDTSAEEAPAEGEPDLRGIPDVVAVVNDEEISKDDFVMAYENQFQQQQMQAQMSGEPVDQDALKQQTAEGLVGNTLLLQEAERRDIDASDKVVDDLLADYAEQSGAESPEAYLETLEQQGLEEDEARSQLADQARLDELLAEEGGDDKPSEEELKALYDQVVAQQEQAPQGEGEQETPSFEEMRPQLEEQAASQKEGEVAQALIEKLREEADVEIRL
ncbi:SurA N-terminal domain-containing protein [Aeromicrobium sp. CTD01-1L150]|uniref:SurA N-terminal domain-containing protein n=1 Tax=Aeromicrobium sp. CTD01-1L150 TaxID=3341830 RepID=UPI0035BF6D5F